MTDIFKEYENGTIDTAEVTKRIGDFYDDNTQENAEEVLFYFYNIAEAVGGKSDPAKANKYFQIAEIISTNFINVSAIESKIVPPQDKMGDVDPGRPGGFSVVTYGKYPAPKSYTPPPPPPSKHNFTNPYTNKNFQSICDWVRSKLFDMFIEDHIETIEDFDGSSITELVPDSNEFENFPQWVDEDGESEDLDFENPGDYVINNENSITFGGGGDWQEPKTFSMKIENGKIKAFDIHDDYDDNEYGGIVILKTICKIFGLDINNYDIDSTDPKDLDRLYNDMVKNKDYKLAMPKVVKDISTEDCVDAIINNYPNETSDFLNPKNWKRLSKSGSGIYFREFQNKVTNQKVKVTATKTQITKIEKI
jgi:hypothetical protein